MATKTKLVPIETWNLKERPTRERAAYNVTIDLPTNKLLEELARISNAKISHLVRHALNELIAAQLRIVNVDDGEEDGVEQ